MMQEWKVRQKAFHHMVTEHEDDLNKVDIVIDCVGVGCVLAGCAA